MIYDKRSPYPNQNKEKLAAAAVTDLRRQASRSPSTSQVTEQRTRRMGPECRISQCFRPRRLSVRMNVHNVFPKRRIRQQVISTRHSADQRASEKRDTGNGNITSVQL
jgi:hypothetical protein